MSIILILLTSRVLFAGEVILSVTDNDDNHEVYNLIAEVNEKDQSLGSLFKDVYLYGKKLRREILNPDDLKINDGMIIEKRDNYNVLNLKSDNFDIYRGGRIVIDTLFNAISGERRMFDLELALDKDSWKLFKNQKIVSKFHVKVNKIIVMGTVGIKTIIME